MLTSIDTRESSGSRDLGSDPTGPTRCSIRALSSLLVAGLAGFILLALAYERDPLAAIDREVAESVAADMPIWAEWLARPPSWVGGWIGMIPICVGLVVLLLVTGRRADALWAAIAFVGIHLVVTPLLKEAFDRPRPDEGSAVPLPSSDSFPSGHASGAVVTFGVLTVLAVERWPRRERVLVSVAAVGVVLVGASRVALNVHYVSDVLAGWCLGLAWLAGCLLARDAVRARRAS